jgi:hypothetical protein
MADFNLRTLYDCRPATYLCFKCLALLDAPPMPVATPKVADKPRTLLNPKCPLCGVEYVPTKAFDKFSADKFLSENGLELKFDKALSRPCGGYQFHECRKHPRSDVFTACSAKLGAVFRPLRGGTRLELTSVSGRLYALVAREH